MTIGLTLLDAQRFQPMLDLVQFGITVLGAAIVILCLGIGGALRHPAPR